MTSFKVIYDANVLYPAPLRDLLMWIALQDVVLARWTDEIHNEWTRNVLKNRQDLKPEQLQRTRESMDSSVRDCLVTGYQALIPGLKLPDPDDRHVLAAAIKAGASVIVTFNEKDFPAEVLDPYGIEAQHPDDFLVYQFDLNKAAVCNAVRLQRATLNLPERLCHERNAARPDRTFGPHVVRQQSQQLRRSMRGLQREGFRYVFEIRTPEEVAQVQIERQPLWNNRRWDRGPFDIIGDVHGCFDELAELLAGLGYVITASSDEQNGDSFDYAVVPPTGRKAIFVGDLVDRGPKVVPVLKLVMSMVRQGHALCLPGNHDAKLLRKLRGKDVQMASTRPCGNWKPSRRNFTRNLSSSSTRWWGTTCWTTGSWSSLTPG